MEVQVKTTPDATGNPNSMYAQAIVLVDSQGNPYNASGISGNQIFGQVKMTGSPVQLPAHALVGGVTLKSKNTNNPAGIFLGPVSVTMTDDGTGNGFKMNPGEGQGFNVNNMNLLYAIGTNGDVLYFTGD